ncbi:MAG: hypothetical protein AMQ74_01746 [Candidatus Methanofastidiosum methylothiophilum]|uniref:Uncharacterized protein n=1 Tax=Candidatus Methanofastidiosum methylothiophilum TaxID=1705564 RepID=A0A150IP73_9EURY|nr:MAG: hypothetical protein AMQ74_01746 [Candidatus Methanofastidiosum methylthiophilus]
MELDYSDEFDPEPDEERDSRIEKLQGKICNKELLFEEELKLLNEVLADYFQSSEYESLSEKKKELFLKYFDTYMKT